MAEVRIPEVPVDYSDEMLPKGWPKHRESIPPEDRGYMGISPFALPKELLNPPEPLEPSDLCRPE